MAHFPLKKKHKPGISAYFDELVDNSGKSVGVSCAALKQPASYQNETF